MEMIRVQQKEQLAYRHEMEERRRRESAEHREKARYKIPKPVFKKLEDNDGIENFFETFERIATQHR